ncbi:glycosyltransferase family 2 protein [Georgenia muralis]|uniref:GT2 family glycosyltransferase n=1 Tax=Georgenia muralis TaxID=154117 RepID=A0A3N5A3L0_9MICO|nr:glycosyltransferase [Georgenia muralis]RPF26391.1 GT2 family glycosyltransferase [Georgenia muralis]
MRIGDQQVPTLGVCVVTYERPDFLVRCLRSLADERPDLEDVVVVDASVASSHELVESSFPGATYVHDPGLAGWMTRSRNEALIHVRGDVVAFLDDDVVVRPGWAAALRAAFLDPTVQAVSGRTCNGLPGEESYHQPVGRLLPNGRLTAGFAAALPGPVEVDHGIGANMSFRRTALAELGGFRDDYPGTALREDTDMFLRVGALGGRVVFVPGAVVDHRPAPHVKGARFDTRYKLYGRRNHVVLLARHAGGASPLLWRWIAGQFRDVLSAGGPGRIAQRLGVTLVGVVWGLAVLPSAAGLRPLPPRRADDASRRIRAVLSDGPPRAAAQ